MSELKCTECGEILTEEMTECPKCGCPVEKRTDISEKLVIGKAGNDIVAVKKRKINICAAIALIIGCLVLFMGSSLIKKAAYSDAHEASSYQVDSAVFGADFYTEIYQASDTIVDELSDINSGIATVSESVNAQINAIYYTAGMIIIALGLVIISVSIININKE